MDEYTGMSDANLVQLADDHGVPHDMEQLRPDNTLDPAARERLIIALRRNRVSPVSNTMYNIHAVTGEYEELFPEDQASRELFLVRVPPQTGVRPPTGESYGFQLGQGQGQSGASTENLADSSWYTAYTTPGGAQYLQEQGYEVRRPGEESDETGVVIQMPQHRARNATTVGVESYEGRHRSADILNFPQR